MTHHPRMRSLSPDFIHQERRYLFKRTQGIGAGQINGDSLVAAIFLKALYSHGERRSFPPVAIPRYKKIKHLLCPIPLICSRYPPGPLGLDRRWLIPSVEPPAYHTARRQTE